MAADLTQRFEAEILAAQARWSEHPLRWGKDDCLMALAAIVQAATGKDVGKPYRGRYRSQRGAERVLGARGVPGALSKAARSLGWRPIAPHAAQTGSLGMVMTPAGPAGVMRYGDLWIGRVREGFACVVSDAVLRAWGPCA